VREKPLDRLLCVLYDRVSEESGPHRSIIAIAPWRRRHMKERGQLPSVIMSDGTGGEVVGLVEEGAR